MTKAEYYATQEKANMFREEWLAHGNSMRDRITHLVETKSRLLGELQAKATYLREKSLEADFDKWNNQK